MEQIPEIQARSVFPVKLALFTTPIPTVIEVRQWGSPVGRGPSISRRAICLLGVVLLVWDCAVIVRRASGAPTVDDLMNAHTTTIGLLHSFDAKIDIYEYKKPGDASSAAIVSKWRWSKNGDRPERIRHFEQLLADGSKNKPINRIGDVFYDGRNTRFLRDWNPDEKPSLSIGDQKGVYAFIAPELSIIPSRTDPSRLLLMRFQLTNNDTPSTLPVLVKRFPVIDGPVPQQLDGRELWRLKLGAKNGGTNSPSYFEIFLDPEAGYLVRKAVILADLGNSQSHTLIRQVTRFANIGDGVFFPEEVETFGTENYVSVARVKSLVVNKPLPGDALDFSFPDSCLVQHLPADTSGRVRVDIWGPNNEPIRELLRDEQARAAAALVESVLEPAHRNWALITVNAVVVILIVLAPIAWRGSVGRRRAK